MVAVTESNLHMSLGALLIGGFVATALSGVVAMQAILYLRLFENDATFLKATVCIVFLLDILHTSMVWGADWQYMVGSFGNKNITDHVFWTAGLTIALTAVTTLSVQLFFTYRLFRLSKANYFIITPLLILAFARLVSAIATSVEFIRLGSFYTFYTHYRWLFTLGLVLSTALDSGMTFSLCAYLRKSRSGGSGRLDHILDAVTLYTVENGMVTCIVTILSLIMWLVKPHALIYLGLHFVISKLYANSFLASMNARKLLRVQNPSSSSGNEGHRMPVIFAHHFARSNRQPGPVDLTSTKLQITVDKTVDYAIDEESSSPGHQQMSAGKAI